MEFIPVTFLGKLFNDLLDFRQIDGFHTLIMANKMRSAYSRFMHPRNRHQSRYDLEALKKSHPPLAPFIIINKFGDESVDFASPEAVKALNQAILKHFYHVDWDLPKNFLTPPIPGRADYIHFMADIIGIGAKKVLDIGVGANCVYPIIGNSEYGWEFVGSDINPEALKAAEQILKKNPKLKIELRLQKSSGIFKGIIGEKDFFHLTICNPPFHSSQEEAEAGTTRKWKNLGKHKAPVLNFGGTSSELWTKGGEIAFIKQMILESAEFKSQVEWFSTLVSKSENLQQIYRSLEKVKARNIQTIEMSQGQKKSRAVVWQF